MSLNDFLPNGEARVLWSRFESLVGQQVFRLRVEGEAANIPSSLCSLLTSNLSSPERMHNFDPDCTQSGHLQRNTNALEIDKQPLYGLPYIAQSMCPLLSLILLTMQELRTLDRNVDSFEAERRIRNIKRSLLDVHKKALLLESQLHQYINPTLVTTLNRRSAKATFEAELMCKLIDKLRKDSRQSATQPEKRKRVCELTMKLKALLCRQKCEWQCVGRLKETLAMARDMKGVLKFICQLSCLLQHCSDASRRLTERPPPYEYHSSYDSSSKQDSSDALYEDLKSSSNRCQPCPSQSSQSEVTISLSLDFTSDREFCDRSYDSDNTTGTRTSNSRPRSTSSKDYKDIRSDSDSVTVRSRSSRSKDERSVSERMSPKRQERMSPKTQGSSKSDRRSRRHSIDSETKSSVHSKSHRSSSVPSSTDFTHPTQDMPKMNLSRGSKSVTSKTSIVSQSKILAEKTINELIDVLEDYIENRSESQLQGDNKSSTTELASSEFTDKQSDPTYSNMETDPQILRSPSRMSPKRSDRQSISLMPNNLNDFGSLDRHSFLKDVKNNYIATHSSTNDQGGFVTSVMSRKYLEEKGVSDKNIDETRVSKWESDEIKMSKQYPDDTRMSRNSLNEYGMNQQRFSGSKMSRQDNGETRMSIYGLNEIRMSKQSIDDNRLRDLDEARMSKQNFYETTMSKQYLDGNRMSKQGLDETRMSKQGLDETRIRKQSLDESVLSKLDRGETKMDKLGLNETKMSKQCLDETIMSNWDLDEARMSKQYHDETRMSKQGLDETRVSKQGLQETRISKQGLDETKISRPSVDEMRMSKHCRDEKKISKHGLNETRLSKQDLDVRQSNWDLDDFRLSKQDLDTKLLKQDLDETRLSKHHDETRMSKQYFDEIKLSKRDLEEPRINKQDLDEDKMRKLCHDKTRMSIQDLADTRLSKLDFDETRISKQGLDETGRSKQGFDETTRSKQEHDDTRMSRESLNNSIQSCNDSTRSRQDTEEIKKSKIGLENRLSMESLNDSLQSCNDSTKSKQDPEEDPKGRKMSGAFLNDSRLGSQVFNETKRSRQNIDETRMSKQDLDETRRCRQDTGEIKKSKQDMDEIRKSRQDFEETKKSKQYLSEIRKSKQDFDDTRKSTQDFDETRRCKQELDNTRERKQDLDDTRRSKQDPDETKMSRKSINEGRGSPKRSNETRKCKQDLDETKMSRKSINVGRGSPERFNETRRSKQDLDETTTSIKSDIEGRDSPERFNGIRSKQDLDEARMSRKSLNRGRDSPERSNGIRSKQDPDETRMSRKSLNEGRDSPERSNGIISKQDPDETRMSRKSLNEVRDSPERSNGIRSKQDLDEARMSRKSLNEGRDSPERSNKIRSKQDLDESRMSRKSLNEGRGSPERSNGIRSKKDLDETRMSKQILGETRMSNQEFDEPRMSKKSLHDSELHSERFSGTRRSKQVLDDGILGKQDLDEIKISKTSLDEYTLSAHSSKDSRISKQEPDETQLSEQNLGETRISRSLNVSRLSPEHFNVIERSKQVLDATRISRTSLNKSVPSPCSSNDFRMSKHTLDETRMSRQDIMETKVSRKGLNEIRLSDPQGFSSSTRMGIQGADQGRVSTNIFDITKKVSPTKVCQCLENLSLTRICKNYLYGNRMDTDNQRMSKICEEEPKMNQKDLDDLIHKQCLDRIKRGKINCNDTIASIKPCNEEMITKKCSERNRGNQDNIEANKLLTKSSVERTIESQDNLEAARLKQLELKRRLAIECANVVQSRIASFSSLSDNKQIKISKESCISISPPRAKREDIDKVYSSYEISKNSLHESERSSEVTNNRSVEKSDMVISRDQFDTAELKDHSSSIYMQLDDHEHETENKNMDDMSANKNTSDFKISRCYSHRHGIDSSLDTCLNRRTRSLVSKKSDGSKCYMQPRSQSSDSSGSRKPLLFSSIDNDINFDDDDDSVFNYKMPKLYQQKQSKKLRQSCHNGHSPCFSGNESELLEDTTTTTDSCKNEITFSHKSSFKSSSNRPLKSSRAHSVGDTEDDINQEVDFEVEMDADLLLDSRSDALTDQPSIDSDRLLSMNKLKPKIYKSKRSLSQSSHRKSKSHRHKRSVSQSSGKTSSVVERLSRKDVGSRFDTTNTSPMRPILYDSYEGRTSSNRQYTNEHENLKTQYRQSSDLSPSVRLFSEGILPVGKHDSICASIISGMRQSQYYETDLFKARSAKLISPVLSQKSIAHRYLSIKSRKSSIPSALYHCPIPKEETNSLHRGVTTTSRRSHVSAPSSRTFGQSPLQEETSLTHFSNLAQSLLHTDQTTSTITMKSLHGDSVRQSQMSAPSSGRILHSPFQNEPSLTPSSNLAQSLLHSVQTASTLAMKSLHGDSSEKPRQSQVSAYSDGRLGQSLFQREPSLTPSSNLTQFLSHSVQTSTLAMKSLHGDSSAAATPKQSPVEELPSWFPVASEQALLHGTLTASTLPASVQDLSSTSRQLPMQTEPVFTQPSTILTQSALHIVPTASALSTSSMPMKHVASHRSESFPGILHETFFLPVPSTIVPMRPTSSATTPQSKKFEGFPFHGASSVLTYITPLKGDTAMISKYSQTISKSEIIEKIPSQIESADVKRVTSSMKDDISVVSKYTETLPQSPEILDETSLPQTSSGFVPLAFVQREPSASSQQSQMLPQSPEIAETTTFPIASPAMAHITSSVVGDTSMTSRHTKISPQSPGTGEETSFQKASSSSIPPVLVHRDISEISKHSHFLEIEDETSLLIPAPSVTRATSLKRDTSVISKQTQTFPQFPGVEDETSITIPSPAMTHTPSVKRNASVISKQTQTFPGIEDETYLLIPSPAMTHAPSVKGDTSVISKQSQTFPGIEDETSLLIPSPAMTHVTSVKGDTSVISKQSQTSPGIEDETSLLPVMPSPAMTHATSMKGDTSVISKQTQTFPGIEDGTSLLISSPTMTRATSVKGDTSVILKQSQTFPGLEDETSILPVIPSPAMTRATSVKGDTSVISKQSKTFPGIEDETSLLIPSPTMTRATSVKGDTSVISKQSQTFPRIEDENSLLPVIPSPAMTRATSVKGDTPVISKRSQTFPQFPEIEDETSVTIPSPAMTRAQSVKGDTPVISKRSQTFPQFPEIEDETSVKIPSPAMTRAPSVKGDTSVISKQSQIFPGLEDQTSLLDTPVVTRGTSLKGDPSGTEKYLPTIVQSPDLEDDMSSLIPSPLVIRTTSVRGGPVISEYSQMFPQTPGIEEEISLQRASSAFVPPTLVQGDLTASRQQSPILPQSFEAIPGAVLLSSLLKDIQGDLSTLSRQSQSPTSLSQMLASLGTLELSGVQTTPQVIKNEALQQKSQDILYPSKYSPLQEDISEASRHSQLNTDVAGMSRDAQYLSDISGTSEHSLLQADFSKPITRDLSGTSEYSSPSRQSPSKSLKQSITRKSFTPESDIPSASTQSSLRTSPHGSISAKRVSMSPYKEVFESYEDTEQVETLYSLPSSISSLPVKGRDFDLKMKWWISVPLMLVFLIFMYYCICYLANIGGCVGCRAPVPNIFFSLINTAIHSVRLIHTTPAPV